MAVFLIAIRRLNEMDEVFTVLKVEHLIYTYCTPKLKMNVQLPNAAVHSITSHGHAICMMQGNKFN